MTQLELPCHAELFEAPTDVILADTTVVIPDLLLVATENAYRISLRGIEGPPDVVVEILSPSNRDRDRYLKRELYERFGVPEYWVVDPDLGQIVQHVRGDDDKYSLIARFHRGDTLTSPRFPQIAVPLAPVFKPRETSG